MLKSLSPNGDSLFSQEPPENAAKEKVSSDGSSSSSSSCFGPEDSSTSALEIIQTSDKPTSYVRCVKNEPVDNSADLLLDDSLRLQIERSIEIVVNEFSFGSNACNTAASVANDTEAHHNGSKKEKLDQYVVDSFSAARNNVADASERQPPASRSTASSHNDSSSHIRETITSVNTSHARSTTAHSEIPNVKSEPRDGTTNQSYYSGSLKDGASVSSSRTLPTMSDICSTTSATGADLKPNSATLRSSCFYSSATTLSKGMEYALTPSVTMSSMTSPKVCSNAIPLGKMTNNVCQVSVKPISRAISSQPPATGYTPFDGDPRRLATSFMAPSSTFPNCCDSSKSNMNRSQFPLESSRYPLDSFSGCLMPKTDPSFPSCSSLPSSLATSSTSSLSTSCFCTNSCYGKPCSRLPPLQNQLLGNSSLSQRALNLHNSCDLYSRGVPGAVPSQTSQSFDYYRPKSSGPSYFRVPSSPISRYSLPHHLPPKEPSSPHMSSLTPYGNSAVANDALKSSSSFFNSTPTKSLKNWNGSAAAAATAACMLQNPSASQPSYKFPMPRIPPSSPSLLSSSYVHSSSMTAPAPPAPSFLRFGDPNQSAHRLYNAATATSFINSPTAEGLKLPQHQDSSVLQQYPFGSSAQKSQCCFPSQLQCYTNCCKDTQQQFSFV